MVSTLAPGDIHSLRTVSLECPLLVSLTTEEETLAVLSRSVDCVRWGLGLVGAEDTTSIIIMDIPFYFSSLDTTMQVPGARPCYWSSVVSPCPRPHSQPSPLQCWTTLLPRPLCLCRPSPWSGAASSCMTWRSAELLSSVPMVGHLWRSCVGQALLSGWGSGEGAGLIGANLNM